MKKGAEALEKNILAFYKSEAEAQKAARQLEALGTIDMSIERFSKNPGGELNSITNPITGEISSLATLSLNADISGRDDEMTEYCSPLVQMQADIVMEGKAALQVVMFY